jgi:hypothetical protein
VVAHDTTEFSFSSPREGLGRINDAGALEHTDAPMTPRQGFFAHLALAVSADGMRRPLGVVGLHTFTRQSPPKLLVLERHKLIRLSPHATARAALLAIAKLGGHIKKNGEPGWIVLGRGFQKLLDLEEGALVALNL